jgi:ORMDL family
MDRTSLSASLDGEGLPNRNTEWVNGRGTWMAYILILCALRVVLGALLGDGSLAWTVMQVGHAVVTFFLFHWVKGVPFSGIWSAQGAWDDLTMWFVYVWLLVFSLVLKHTSRTTTWFYVRSGGVRSCGLSLSLARNLACSHSHSLACSHIHTLVCTHTHTHTHTLSCLLTLTLSCVLARYLSTSKCPSPNPPIYLSTSTHPSLLFAGCRSLSLLLDCSRWQPPYREQVDKGRQYTPSRKFFTIVPILL